MIKPPLENRISEVLSTKDSHDIQNTFSQKYLRQLDWASSGREERRHKTRLIAAPGDVIAFNETGQHVTVTSVQPGMMCEIVSCSFFCSVIGYTQISRPSDAFHSIRRLGHSTPAFSGDIVHLNSGGPDMEALKVNAQTNEVTCLWTNALGKLISTDIILRAVSPLASHSA